MSIQFFQQTLKFTVNPNSAIDITRKIQCILNFVLLYCHSDF